MKKHPKHLFGLFVSFCLAACFLPMHVSAAPDQTTPIVIDVGGANVDEDAYAITDTGINLKQRDVVYKLTGTTDKKLNFWGSNNSADIDQAYYLTLNNVTANGGIQIQNSPVKMVITVPENTVNNLGLVVANDLTIQGSGTLNTTDLSVGQQNTLYMPSALTVTDTTINVTLSSKRYSQMNGTCVLGGNATITYRGGGTYAPLHLGEESRHTHSLLLKDQAKLYCLQDDPDTPAASSVSGLEAFQSATITLTGSSYLEAEGKDSTGGYFGMGVCSGNPIYVQDNATLKTTGYDIALWAGSLNVTGGTVIANSHYGNGICADDISISDATVEASGYYPALYGANSLTISDSKIKATSSSDVAIFSPGDVTISQSILQTTSADDYDGILSRKTLSIRNSWFETTDSNSYDGTLTDSTLFNGTKGKVIGSATLPFDFTLSDDMTLDIPEGASFTVPEGITFTNNGTVQVEGSVANQGTLICNSHTGGTATCAKKAVCKLCAAEYGELAPDNHTDLQHVEAKAATTTSEGNVEYWYCKDCGKYYSDKEATKEMKQADTVIAKLADKNDKNDKTDKNDKNNKTDKNNNADKDTKTDKNSAKKTNSKTAPKSGDSSSLLFWSFLLLLGGCGSFVTWQKRKIH